MHINQLSNRIDRTSFVHFNLLVRIKYHICIYKITSVLMVNLMSTIATSSFVKLDILCVGSEIAISELAQ